MTTLLGFDYLILVFVATGVLIGASAGSVLNFLERLTTKARPPLEHEAFEVEVTTNPYQPCQLQNALPSAGPSALTIPPVLFYSLLGAALIIALAIGVGVLSE